MFKDKPGEHVSLAETSMLAVADEGHSLELTKLTEEVGADMLHIAGQPLIQRAVMPGRQGGGPLGTTKTMPMMTWADIHMPIRKDPIYKHVIDQSSLGHSRSFARIEWLQPPGNGHRGHRPFPQSPRVKLEPMLTTSRDLHGRLARYGHLTKAHSHRPKRH